MEFASHFYGGAVSRASYFSSSPEETAQIAYLLGTCLQGGELLLLAGELGAGKTCFVAGLARGLNINEPVQSPSFTLMNEYPPARDASHLGLQHFDAYRLSSANEWFELGFSDYPSPGCVAAVEWPERVAEALPRTALLIELCPTVMAAENEQVSEEWMDALPPQSRRIDLYFPPTIPAELKCKIEKTLVSYACREE